MTVLVAVTQSDEVATLIAWGLRVARAEETKLAVVVVQRQRGQLAAAEKVPSVLPAGAEPESAVLAAVRQELAVRRDRPEGAMDASGKGQVPRLWRLRHERPIEALVELVAEVDADLLIAGERIMQAAAAAASAGGEPLSHMLLRDCPCRLLLLRGGDSLDGPAEVTSALADSDAAVQRTGVLVPVAGGVHGRQALRLAAKLLTSGADRCDALYVQPPGPPEAEDVGRVHLRRCLREAGVAEAGFGELVRVDQRPRQVIGELAAQYALVMVGASDRLAIGRALHGTVPAQLLAGATGTTVAVLRRAEPVHARWLRLIEEFIQARLPQLDRDARVDLTERLQDGSRAGVDFILLILLATVIAGLGLIADSTAVVVGAMLVAPLMTPIVGAGLAVVQGNRHLVQVALRSIGIGFLLALAVGYLLGLVTGLPELTDELQSRGRPGVLDLFVAFFSGVAAAYALSRPNLSAALPGVAIAAALVPPIATVGIALADGHWYVAEGAALLFTTNVVAIILGAAGALAAVGLRPATSQGRVPAWVPRLLVALLLGLAVLLVPLIWWPLRWPEAALPQLDAAVDDWLDDHPGWCAWDLRAEEVDGRLQCTVFLGADQQPDQAQVDELRQRLHAGCRRAVDLRLVVTPVLESRAE